MKTTTPKEGDSPARRATAIPQDGRVVMADGDQVSRVLVYLVGTYIARINRQRAQLFGQDLDLGTVFEAIGSAGVEPGMRDADFREKFRDFSTIVGVEGQRAINALSISAATGIPRETVRRKLKRLVEQNLIMEKSKGQFIVVPGTYLRPEFQDAYAKGIRETLSFINRCLEQGALKWQGHPPKA